MKTKRMLQRMRSMPLFPIVPLLPLAYIAGSLYGLIAINRRLRHMEALVSATRAPT